MTNDKDKANNTKTVKIANVQPITYVIDQHGCLVAIHKGMTVSQTIDAYAKQGK